MQVDFEKFTPNLFRFALSLCRNRHMAEDLVQETFLKAYRAAHSLKDESTAKSWLFTILVNVWKDECRQSANKHYQPFENETLARNPSPEIQIIQKEENNRIFGLMQSLPEKQRTALFLRVVEGFSIKQIANLCHATENSVKANISVARKTLREKLTKNRIDC